MCGPRGVAGAEVICWTIPWMAQLGHKRYGVLSGR